MKFLDVCIPEKFFERPVLECLITAVLDIDIKLSVCIVIYNLTDSRKDNALLPMSFQLCEEPAYNDRKGRTVATASLVSLSSG